MGYVIAGVSTCGFLALIGHAARNDDTSQSSARNALGQILVVLAALAVIGVVVWVATYGN